VVQWHLLLQPLATLKFLVDKVTARNGNGSDSDLDRVNTCPLTQMSQVEFHTCNHTYG
jgi:hypothetical protein